MRPSRLHHSPLRDRRPPRRRPPPSLSRSSSSPSSGPHRPLLRRARQRDPHRRLRLTYTYATLGELIAWIIGWDLVLEYAVSDVSVSVGFAAHIVNSWTGSASIPPPDGLPPPPGGLQDLAGHDISLPAGTSASISPPFSSFSCSPSSWSAASASPPAPTTSWCWSNSAPS